MVQVPRYTSYPTAPHFHAGVNGKIYGKMLRELSNKDTLSLYFHIPFCRQLCWFCGCHTKIVNGYDPIKIYMELLQQEVSLVADKASATDVKHIHFGGGSPTVLNAPDFSDFMSHIRANFTILPQAEIAVEMDPRTVNKDKIVAYAQTGVNRVSLGVQDFDKQVQYAINRVQSYKLVRGVVDDLRQHGIDALNIDLIYGLPFQTLDTTRDTIERALTLEPDRISLFGYAHVPWMKKHQKLVPEHALPSSQLRMDMFNYAASEFEKAGYIAIGLDHFVKPDDALAKALHSQSLQRNFQGYTNDTADALLGLGVSAISTLPGSYIQNTSDYQNYMKSINNSELPIAKGIELSKSDRERRDIIMSLMCNLSAEVPKAVYEAHFEQLQPYLNNGEVSYKDGILHVLDSARHKLRIVAAIFDEYLQESAHRYSRAV